MARSSGGDGIEFLLLGPVEAVRNGDVLRLGGKRQKALLALLLLQPGRAVPVDTLADELWNGEPPAGAETTIRSYVSRLRSVLGDEPALASTGAGYALATDPERVDAARFERLAREGHEALARGSPRRAAERLRAALELWRGDALAELADEGALRREASRLHDLRLAAVEARLDADLRLGRATELVEELEQLVEEAPYHERLWSHLMLALYRAGRQADALAAYRRARTRLDELGLEPGEELRRLEQAILRQEVEAVDAAGGAEQGSRTAHELRRAGRGARRPRAAARRGAARHAHRSRRGRQDAARSSRRRPVRFPGSRTASISATSPR